MDRPVKIAVHWPAENSRSRVSSFALTGVGLLGVGLLAILCSLAATTAEGAEPGGPPATRLLNTPVSFAELVQLLDDPRPAIRLEAINYIQLLNRPAGETVPVLKRRFDDPDLGVRAHAVQVALRAGMPAEQAVPVAAQLLVPENPAICCLAARILGDIGPPAKDALPNLRACLTASSASAAVRADATRAVLKINPSEAATLEKLHPIRQAGAETKTEPELEAPDFAANAWEEVDDRLTEFLNHNDPYVRRAAIIRFEELGLAAASATPALVERLNDPDLLVRAFAARAAFRAGLPAELIVAVVPDLLDPENLDVLRVAALTVTEIGPDAKAALPKLHECLDSPAIAVRLHAAEAALRIDPTDRPALMKLLSALRHDQPDVRFFAVNSLGAAVMDSDLAVFALQLAISDPHPKVATAAALHLARAHDLSQHHLPEFPLDSDSESGAVPCDASPWIATLTNAAASDRRSAAICLAIAGPMAREAVPHLIDRLGDRNPVVRLHVAQALWEIDHNGYPIIPVLVDLLMTNRGGTRIGAIYTLGRMGHAASDALPWLSQMLKDSKSIDRLLLAEAIVRIEPENIAAQRRLVRGVYSPKTDVRYLATVAIGSVPTSIRGVVEQALSVAADDRSSRVRAAAFETLSQLQVREAMERFAKRRPVEAVVPAAADGP